MTQDEFIGLKKHIASLRKAAKEAGESEAGLKEILTEEELGELLDFAQESMASLSDLKKRIEWKEEKIQEMDRRYDQLQARYEQAHPIWSVLVAFIQVPIVTILGAILEHKFPFLSAWHIGHMLIALSAFFGFILVGQAASRDDWNRRI